MTTKNIKTALAAVTLAAATLATPFAAQAQDYRGYNDECNDTSNSLLGAVIGGTAGAVLGDGIAGRGESTEFGILGAVLGGAAGAAAGDRFSDCEDYNTRDSRGYETTTSYPAQTYPTQTYPAQTYPTTSYPTTSYPTQSYPTQTYPAARTTYPATTTYPASGTYQTAPSRTVYTSPRVVQPATTTYSTSPVYESQPTYSAPVYTAPTTTVYGNSSSDRGPRIISRSDARLNQIDREIHDLRREREGLKDRLKHSRHYDPGAERRLEYISACLDDLKKERKHVKKYGVSDHNGGRY